MCAPAKGIRLKASSEAESQWIAPAHEGCMCAAVCMARCSQEDRHGDLQCTRENAMHDRREGRYRAANKYIAKPQARSAAAKSRFCSKQ